MALERRNPLPVGLYWQDVFDKDHDAFEDWLKRNHATVTSIRNEHFDAQSEAEMGVPTGGLPGRDWYLFQVTAPTKWEGPGFPTKTTDANLTSEDTVQRPDPPKPPEDVIEKVVKIGGLAVFGFLALKLLQVLRGK
jgi:hypothetical protein